MISSLGAEGAANLQRQMTEHTLLQARNLTANPSLTVEVHFTGGDRYLMENWLGSDLVYQPQSQGDLGERIKEAISIAFSDGMKGVVTIGTDCPDLNATLINEAFEALAQGRDLVLGPATDGGYYLIGLSRLIPELFTGINWGTSQVLEQTKTIAQRLDLSIHYLTFLSDVDRLEDLKQIRWQPII